MLGIHGILDAHNPINLPLFAMEPTVQSFTITVTAALSGKVFWTFASQHAGSLFVWYLKLTIQKRLGLPSPFAVFFFAPRAVRPNSPVTIEQKKDPSPFQANHNDRSRSGRPHSPQPGMQSSSRQEGNNEANKTTHKKPPGIVKKVAYRNCTKFLTNLNAAHSDSRVLTQQPIEISKKVPAHREKAKIPISVVKQ